MNSPTPDHTNPDDELGAALGRSVRNRVDNIPTITPGFDGVERRARQITNRRRALAGAALGAFLLLGGIGVASLSGDDSTADQDTVNNPDVDDPPDTDLEDTDSDAVNPGLDDIVVTGLIEKARFVRVEGETETELYSAGPGEVLSDGLQLADGSILIELHDDPLAGAGRVVHISAPGAEPAELGAFSDLAGGAVVDGIPYAFVGDVPDFGSALPGEDRLTGDLRRIDLRDYSEIVFLEHAYGIESSVDNVDVHGSRVLVAISSEAGPTWTVHTIDGQYLGVPANTNQGAAVNAWGARFDEEGDGFVWISQDFGTASYELVGGNFDGTEAFAVPFAPADTGAQPNLSLQADGGLIAVNVEVFDDHLRYAETIWIDLDDGPSNEVEPGEVIFVQSAQSSGNADDTPDDTPPVDSETTGEWQPLAELGLVGLRGSLAFDITSSIPTERALVGVVDTNVVRYDPDGSVTSLVGDPDITAARIAADGSVLIELANRLTVSDLRPSATAVIQIRGDDYRVLSPDGRLNGVAEIGGRPVAFVGDYPAFNDTPESDTADLRMVDLESGDSTIIGEQVFGIEWLIYEVFVGGDSDDPTILLDGAGYQPFWAYRDIEGNLVDLASPTDGRYGSDWANEVDGVGPNADRPALSTDGTTLYWVEVEPGDPATLTPIAVIHSMDVATGEEGPTIDVSLGFTEIALHTDLTISGDQLLLARSFDGVDQDGNYVPEYLAPIVVDLASGESQVLAGVPGAHWHFAGEAT